MNRYKGRVRLFKKKSCRSCWQFSPTVAKVGSTNAERVEDMKGWREKEDEKIL